MDTTDSPEEQVDEPGDEGVCGLPSGELSSADVVSGSMLRREFHGSCRRLYYAFEASFV